MDAGAEKKLSKFMSLVLRHDPQAAGLTLDAAGWADVSALVEGACAKGLICTAEDIAHVVAASDKQRFALSGDQRRVRAVQGHSVPVDLGLEPCAPPDILFHGTADKNITAIQAVGLHPQSRQYVHLSADKGAARKVGQRHGKPVVFRVLAAQAAAEGQPFYRAQNGVWLTGPVAKEFLELASDCSEG